MQIVEIKNNLIKISYDTASENLVLSGFMVMKDAAQSFIGQIIHLDANDKGNFAIIKLLFVFNDEGVITPYNGSIPDIDSVMDIVHPSELLEILPIQSPIILGELAQQNVVLKLDRTFLEENLLVCSEKAENNSILTKNLAQQLSQNGKKVLIIDTIGNLDFSPNKIVAGKDFKLPLNYESINFIYEKGLDDATSETKALIQEMFLEVQNYVKTLPEQFIPFQSFKNVVDEQYEQTELIELVLLKNKLLKYYEEGVFAQNKNEFDSLKTSFDYLESTIFDISEMNEKIQREMIAYAYSVANQEEGIYVICNITNENSDKKLLKQIFMANNAYSTLICAYSYKYLKELKQLAKNLILFAPIQQQNDFAGYNIFLSKLNNREFITYGKATQYLPLIVKLEEIENRQEKREEANSQQQLANSEVSQTFPDSNEFNSSASQPFSLSAEEDFSPDLDEEIRQDVDTLYMSPKQEGFETEVVEEFPPETDLTEEDLDLLDDVGVMDESDFEEIEINEEEIENRGWEIDEENNEQQITNSEEDYASMPPDLYASEDDHSGFESFNPSVEEAPEVDILPAKSSSVPVVPVYSADIEPQAQSDELDQGDVVSHPKYGKGTVEKLITYGSKTLCSINFDNVGRRLLDPTLVELKRVNG